MKMGKSRHHKAEKPYDNPSEELSKDVKVKQIIIKVKQRDLHEWDEVSKAIRMKIDMDVELRWPMILYCDKMDLSIYEFRFLYDGARVRETDTPLMLNMVDNDVIYACPKQCDKDPRGRVLACYETLCIRTHKKQDTFVRVVRNKPLLKQLERFYRKNKGGKHVPNCFACKGEKLTDFDSVCILALEDGDIIDAFNFDERSSYLSIITPIKRSKPEVNRNGKSRPKDIPSGIPPMKIYPPPPLSVYPGGISPMSVYPSSVPPMQVYPSGVPPMQVYPNGVPPRPGVSPMQAYLSGVPPRPDVSPMQAYPSGVPPKPGVVHRPPYPDLVRHRSTRMDPPQPGYQHSPVRPFRGHQTSTSHLFTNLDNEQDEEEEDEEDEDEDEEEEEEEEEEGEEEEAKDKMDPQKRHKVACTASVQKLPTQARDAKLQRDGPLRLVVKRSGICPSSLVPYKSSPESPHSWQKTDRVNRTGSRHLQTTCSKENAYESEGGLICETDSEEYDY